MAHFNKGNAFTKLLRRRIRELRVAAKKANYLDKHVDGPTGCSDSYDEGQRAWSRYHEAINNLNLYLEFKGWSQ